MRLYRLLGAVAVIFIVNTPSARAVSLVEFPGAANIPPPGYTGLQYVDNNGCVFVRAGRGDGVTWVPRVTRRRQVICGQRPTFSGAAARAERPDVNPAPTRQAAALAPTETAPVQAPEVATEAGPSAAERRAAQRAADRQARVERRRARRAAQAAARAPSHPTAPVIAPAPVATAARQVATPGTETNAGQNATPQTVRRVVVRRRPAPVPTPTAHARTPEVTAVIAAPTIPKGYRAAWGDGRLNPNRGQGTAEGEARMAQLWSDGTPQRLIATTAPPIAEATSGTQGARTVSGRSTSAAAPLWIQVGAFGDPGNAERAHARLAAQQVPAQLVGARTSRGRSLTVVLAGPFANERTRLAMLRRTRSAGFAEAFSRR